MTKNEAIQKALLLEAENARLEKLCAKQQKIINLQTQRHQEFQQLYDDRDASAPWLSMAHVLCTDYGVKQGHISQRLLILRQKLVDMQTSLVGRTYFHSDAQVEAENKRIRDALKRIEGEIREIVKDALAE